MTALIRLFAAALVAALPGLSFAGEWTVLDGDGREGCNLAFTGPIENGDLMRGIEEGLFTEFLNRICLNSPGGSLGEVHRFLQAVDDGPSFATRVRSGEECLSSCAILFMFGETYGANSPYPSRQMEPGARLGFHSPFIRDDADTGASDAEVFRVALDVAKLLADRSYRAMTAAGPALPQELLALVLGTPSAGMRHVDTLAELRLMGIELTRDLESEAVFTDDRATLERLARQICITSHTLTYREFFVDEGYDFDDLVARATDPEYLGNEIAVEAREITPAEGYSPETYTAALTGSPFAQPGWYSVGAMQYCRVRIVREPAPGGFRVPSYQAEFGYLTQVDLSQGVPKQGQSRAVHAMKGGLLPIDTRYGF